MAKYTLFGSISLLIISIIIFSSFIKDNPSYIGVASTVNKINKYKLTDEKKEAQNGYRIINIPEIAPIVILHEDTPETISSEEEIKEPLKKEALKKEKKKKKMVIIPEVKEEIPLVKEDTFVIPIIVSKDTLSPKNSNDLVQDANKKKKKKKKFLFF
jgi:hypothetical protein